MRARRPPTRPPATRTRSPPPASSPSPNWSCPEYKNIGHALQTLDNQHSLLLLQQLPHLEPPLVCLRANYCHLLARHESCLSSARNCLLLRPTCAHCLPLYMAHSDFSLDPDLPLRAQVMEAVERSQDWSLLRYLPQLQNCRYMRLLRSVSVVGAQVEKVQIVEEGGGRRVQARQHIARDQLILFVPKSRLITLELAQQLPSVRRLLQQRVVLKSPKHCQLALFLLEHFELGTASPFAHYLATLPSHFARFPLHYPPALLDQLRGTCILDQILARRQDIARDYEAIVGCVGEAGRFGAGRFLEARLLVSSRVFGIVVEGAKTDALVPVADMLNHHLPKQTSWYYCDRRKGFVIQSLREIDAGAEVFDSYGQKCNSRFLLNYGFTLPANSHNEVTLELALPPLHHDHQPTPARLRVSRLVDSKGFEEMMSLLRVCALAAQEDSESRETLAAEALKHTAFQSVENEMEAWRVLQRVVGDRLQEYPTDIAEDRRLLAREEDEDMVNVLRLRMGEKEVLMFYQCMARRVLRWLAGNARGQLTSYEPYALSLPL